MDKDGNKTGGRRKGTTNKDTKALREAITVFTSNNLHRINELWNEVASEDPAKAIELLHKLLNYSLPTLRAVEHDMTPESGIRKIEIVIDPNSNKDD